MGKGEEGVTLKSFIFLADSGRSLREWKLTLDILKALEASKIL